jgi:hypothetical protein
MKAIHWLLTLRPDPEMVPQHVPVEQGYIGRGVMSSDEDAPPCAPWLAQSPAFLNGRPVSASNRFS